MLTVGNCRICGTGPLGLRLCGICKNIVILCKECDAAWIDAHLDTKPVYADEESMPCPHCKNSLWSNESTWATEDEVGGVDWINEAIENGDLTLVEQETNEPPTII